MVVSRLIFNIVFVVFLVVIDEDCRLLLEHAVDGAAVLAFLDGLSLVVLLFTAGDSDDEFGKPTLVDEQTQGNYRDAWLLHVLGDAAYFLAVEQELTVTVGGVVVVGAETVLSNIHVLDPHLIVDHHAIGIGQAALALTDGLNLSASQNDTRSEGLDNLVVESSLAVLDVDGVVIVIPCHGIVKLVLK